MLLKLVWENEWELCGSGRQQRFVLKNSGSFSQSFENRGTHNGVIGVLDWGVFYSNCIIYWFIFVFSKFWKTWDKGTKINIKNWTRF